MYSSWEYLDRATSKIREQYEKSAEMVTEAVDNIRTVSMLTMQDYVAETFFGT
jgi:nitrate reductase assembly molybdenum cofactor insertion protein NarJ